MLSACCGVGQGSTLLSILYTFSTSQKVGPVKKLICRGKLRHGRLNNLLKGDPVCHSARARIGAHTVWLEWCAWNHSPRLSLRRAQVSPTHPTQGPGVVARAWQVLDCLKQTSGP